MDAPGRRTEGWAAALIAIGAGLFFLRGVLIPFAMAVILWFVIDSLAHALQKHARISKAWIAQAAAMALVFAVAVLATVVIVGNLAKFASQADAYQVRVDALLGEAHRMLRFRGEAPTVDKLLAQLDLRNALFMTADATREMITDIGLTLLFLIFMFSAFTRASQKLDLVFPKPDARRRAREVITEIQTSIRSYLLISTVASFLSALLTWLALMLIGLENAAYWAVLAFFLNFIPVVGPLVAILLPTAFAVMQFTTVTPVIGTAVAVGVWPFLFGNFLLPRLAGRSLNLSPLVVLLALAVWSILWGAVGAFLAIPLSVMIMIALAQFPSTRPIAIFMSSDGQPHVFTAAPEAAPA